MEGGALVLSWVGRTSIEASVIVGVILLAQRLLRNRLQARWRYALWFILLVRLVFPWTPESSLSLFNAFSCLSENSGATEEATATSLPWRFDLVDLDEPLFTDNTAAFVGESEGSASPVLVDSSWTWSPRRVIAALWLLGVSAFAAHVISENVRFWRRIRRPAPCSSAELLALLERCKASMGVRGRIALVPTDEVTSPAIFGFLRPKLLLPSAMLGRLNADELRYVFLHELAHLKRHDIAVNWLMTALQGIHWFNPVLWYAFYRMRSDRELACDALALTCTDSGESVAYGRTILSLLDRVYTVRRVPGMAGILEDKSQLKRRITMIALFKKNSYRWSLLAALLLAGLGTVLLTGATKESEDATSDSHDSDMAGVSAERVTVDPASGTVTMENVKAERLNIGTNAGDDINAKVAQLDMATATLDDVIRIFGDPERYGWGRETFEKKNLPDVYVLEYSNSFYVVMNRGRVEELRFHETAPPYVFRDKIRVGSSLDEVLSVVGRPTDEQEGVEGWDDGVLYRNHRGNKGVSYYARSDQGVRFFFVDDKVCGLYLTNPQFDEQPAIAGKRRLNQNPRQTTTPSQARSPRRTQSHASLTCVPTRAAGPVEWDGDKIVSRVLPYSDFVSLFIRLPIAHAVATGKGVKIAVLQRSNDDNVRLMIRRVAPDADALGYPVGGGSIDPADLSARFVAEERRIVVIPDVAEWPIDDMKRLATHLVSAGLLVIIPSDLSEDTPAIETVNALHNLGAITVGRVDRQSTVMEPGGEAEMPFNARIRDIETDVFTTVGLYNTLDTNPVATAAGVAALVLERWPDLDGGGIREKIVDGARNVWQATSLETGQWQNKGIRVDPVTTEYTPTGAAEIFRFRVLDAAGSLGVDTAIPWFLNMLNLQEAWKITKGDGTTVAVSDQGFHINHPAIKDSIIRTANFGPVTFDSPKQNFHGTDMSRILHAVAPGARLIPMLCSRSNERGSSGLAGSIAESFRFAAREKVDVVTASWAGQFNTDPDLLSAIQEAVQQGTTVSWFHYPDEYPGVLRSEFTYNGSGETPVLGFADRFLTDPPGFHPVEIEAGLSGTAPQLAGLAALAKSVNAKLTPAQIQQLIRETSTPIGNNVLIPDACRLVVAAKGTQ